ncbi:methyl-accepting chemotaxis protein [Paenibacillus sp. N1-5-1-14]|uniref:methyl-accepting chemotaxis protein n=1 Tax=Paenibacillus radicibacter TaxID=2972488 RepID=UPI002159AE99|nr:methyl-accepting chemotaxis protein [Paenibacillus radicibacter]MCR8644074.1 methyl-accepting chemotaxis protein [Paenibacillus radicibacter]
MSNWFSKVTAYGKKAGDQMNGLAQKFKTKSKAPKISSENRSSDKGSRLVHPLRSVGLKLFFIFFVSILVFVLTVGIFSYQISKSVIQKKVSSVSSEAIVLAQQKLDYFFATYEKMSLQLISDNTLKSQIESLKSLKEGTYEYLETTRLMSDKLGQFSLTDTNVKAIRLFDMSGKQLKLYGEMPGEVDSSRGWFKRVVDQQGKTEWIANGEDSVSKNEDEVAIGRVINDVNLMGGSLGVLVIEISLNTIAKDIDMINLGENDDIVITDKNNMLIYSEKRDQIGKKANIELTEEELKQDKGSSKNDDTQVVYARSALTDWYLVGSVPIRELVKDAIQIFNVTIYAAIIAAILAIFIGLFIMRMIGKPLTKLMNLMREGASGNLTVRSNFKAYDEIGQLGASFDMMMQEITTLVKQTNQSAQEVLETAKELTYASKTTATAAKEIAVATDEISSGAAGLAGESERGTELTHHITEKMKDVIQSNLEMGTAAGEVRSSSEQGTQYMSELISKTTLTEDLVRSMVLNVNNLKESTRSIRKILDVLNNMTKQTNILSLNATIEAARAGVAGKGFMVVADEIRKLADQSKQSIEVVGQITETIQLGIDETVTVLSNAYPIFNEQIVSVKEANTIFDQVQQHMSDFITQLSEVSDSIVELDQSQNVLSGAMTSVSAVAEESLATSEEVASLCSEQLSISESLVKLSDKLGELSNSLQDSLSRFKV